MGVRARLSAAREDATATTPLDGRTGGGEVLPGYPRYVVRGGAIMAARVEGKGEGRVSYWQLANFAAVIRREIRATDGVETETLFEIEGYLSDGQPLPPALVKASEFAAMSWPVREWGSRVVVTPGQGSRDHLRAAIQYLSQEGVERAAVYRHLGWARVDGRWCYLHAGGGITAGEPVPVEVHPGRILEGFVLPNPPDADTEGVRIHQLWTFLEVAPHQVTVPLLLYALAAPLGHAPYTLYLAGPTGARKTSLAVVVQSFFGYREATPPLGWEATPNSLEGAAFAAKDCLLLIDDYAPTGRERDWREIQAKAARLLRSQGNGVGRQRMRADGSLAGDRPPRGSLLVTGEDLPPGHSVRARALFLEIRRGDVDLKRLSEAQRLSREGVYAEAMAAWIRHLATAPDRYREKLRVLTEELRPQWSAEHGRTADALARLHAVWILYRDYAASRGVNLAGLESLVLEALDTVREEQASHQRDADPAQRFVTLLSAALRMGRCHLVPLEASPRDSVDTHLANPSMWGWEYRPTANVWEPQGARIG
ncbi:MAG: DNA primase, partial [Nitrososphaera sp.]